MLNFTKPYYLASVQLNAFSYFGLIDLNFFKKVSFYQWRRFITTYNLRCLNFKQGWLKLPGVLQRVGRVAGVILGRKNAHYRHRAQLNTTPPRLAFFLKKHNRSVSKLNHVNNYSGTVIGTPILHKRRTIKPLLGLKSAPSFFTNNLTPFIFSSSIRGLGSFYARRWLREFRVKTSRFFNINTNRIMINYNLKIVKTRTSWLTGNRFLFNFMLNPAQLTTLKTPLTGLDRENPLNSTRSKYAKRLQLHRLKVRRITTLWVSKITQRTLTPARREFNKLYLRKPLRYQKRITIAIMRYYRFKVLEILMSLEFTLLHTLTRSKLLPVRSLAERFIITGYVTVNGLPALFSNHTLCFMDFVMLTPSIRFILFYKWTLLNVEYIGRKFFYYLRKWRVRSNRPYPKTSSYRIPDWVRKVILYKESTPSYLEIDFTTMSFVNIFEPIDTFNNLHYLTLNTYTPATVRGFNWKSLT